MAEATQLIHELDHLVEKYQLPHARKISLRKDYDTIYKPENLKKET